MQGRGQCPWATRKTWSGGWGPSPATGWERIKNQGQGVARGLASDPPHPIKAAGLLAASLELGPMESEQWGWVGGNGRRGSSLKLQLPSLEEQEER